MPNLAEFQNAFADAILVEERPDRWAHAPAFAVYRNTSARGIVEALRAAFPTVDALLGQEMFDGVALDYRRESPPVSPVLSDYGDGFADFLERQPWSCELPYLADVARLDWAWLGSFLAKGADTLPGSIGATSKVTLHPAARFAWLKTPALTIWQAHRDGFDELEPEWCEEGALFTRPEMTVQHQAIDRVMHRLLLACATPVRFEECVAELADEFPQVDVAELIQSSVATGALIFQ